LQIEAIFVYFYMAENNKKLFADIVVPGPPHQIFTYIIPADIRNDIEYGHRVVVPFGKRTSTGFVTAFSDKTSVENLKEIIEIADPWPLLTEELLNLTRWISDYYMAGWGETIKSALPPGLTAKSKLNVEILSTEEPDNLTNLQHTLFDLVKNKKSIPVNHLIKKYAPQPVRLALNSMEKTGLICFKYSFEKNGISVKTKKKISIINTLPKEEMEKLIKKSPVQAEVIKILMKKKSIWRHEINKPMSVLNRLRDKNLIEIQDIEVYRESLDELPPPPANEIVLTSEQKNAVEVITKSIDKQEFKTFLVHGITGSGKTQVYIESIKHTLSMGKTALVLIPEISLTPQAVMRYRSFFGDKIAVMHSRMASGERYDSWRRIKKGELTIGIGPRSAVFAPLENLGLIIVDEEHDPSFKQNDPSPRYHGRDVAVMRGKLNKAVVVLGSATPSFESYFNTINKKYEIISITERIDKTPLPSVTLVDQKKFTWEKENRIISPVLREKIENRLKKKEQVILLQNRRGYAPFLMCSKCGYIEECKNCDITLTFHRSTKTIECHYCGYRHRAPDVCPKCQNPSMSYRGGPGTEQVEEELQRIFPDARILRMDFDTTRAKGAHTKIIRAFSEHKGDILLGTQMVAKGHDFSGVSLVGIISADTGLFFPDFRAGEKTFQLLTQAAGRAGRRKMQGEVVIQTMSPGHPVLSFVLTHNYKDFFTWENQNRKELSYPPWGKIIAIHFKSSKKEPAEKAAEYFRKALGNNRTIAVLGPAPSPLSRIKNLYRYQIIVKSSRIIDNGGSKLHSVVRSALKKYYSSRNYYNVHIAVNVDPMDML